MKRKRREQSPITNIDTDPRESVCLRVAAEFLGLDQRTVSARIDSGKLTAWRDGGSAWCVEVASIRAYDRRRRQRMAS